MQKLMLLIFSCFLLMISGIATAQHNTCLMAETILDSLNKLHVNDYPNMVFYTDTSSLSNPSELNDVYTTILQSKRPLRAIKREAMHVYECTFKKVKLHHNVNPDSLGKYTAYALTPGGKGRSFINDAGVRFSNILYSSDLVLGYMQLNMRSNTQFYYFIFEKNGKTGNWEMKRLVEQEKK